MQSIKIYRKKYFNVFNVDVEIDGGVIHGWIAHEGYGVKDLMFGAMIGVHPVTGSGRIAAQQFFDELIDHNIYDYIRFYYEAHMQEDDTADVKYVESLIQKFDELGLLADTE